MVRKLCSAFAFAAFTLLGSAIAPAQSVSTHHVREATRNGSAPAVGNLPGTQTLRLDLVLPLRDETGLDNFLADLYNPTSPNFRHFLSVNEFTERFGPTQADYDAVLSFASIHGLTVVGGSRNGMDVQVTGSVTSIERAFHINLRTFKHPSESRNFYGPDSEPTTDLPFNLWHISGLDNFSIPHSMLTNRNEFASAHGINSKDVVSHATTGSGPSNSFLGSDMRVAYYGGTALDGTGQNLGLLEYLGTDLDDLNTYYATATNPGQLPPPVPITLLSTDGTNTSCVDNAAGGNCDDTEQTLDMTQALGMAPNLNSLTLYIGSSDTAIMAAMISNPTLPTTIGCSWGWTPVDPTTLDPYFKRMATQGQTFFAASGDYSTWASTRNREPWPADDPWVVSVGGTDLVTTSGAGPWSSETAWVDSGGGISPNRIAIPSWQRLSGVINSSNHGSTTYRNGPDVSANANFTFYTCADQTTCNANLYGGTSFAAPMWAAYTALVNQQLANNNNGKNPPYIGFLNPIIYPQNITSAYASNFHDITSGTSGSYSAVTGYDLVTGWGSPNANLLYALVASTTAPPQPTPSLTLSASPSTASIRAGGTATYTISVAGAGGFNSSVTLTAKGAPSGSTVSFSTSTIPAPGSGTSTLSIHVPRNIQNGSTTITVTAAGGGLTQTTTVNLTY